MYFKYGSYTHDTGEILLASYTKQRMKSERNRLVFTRHTMELQGEVCLTGQAAIKTRLEAIEAAYSVDGNDAVLYHDDGTQSAHRMISDQSLNGVRVLTFDYPRGEHEQYATGRTYRIVLQADYLTEEDSIYSFSETLTFIGNGGTMWEHIPHFLGPPSVRVVYTQTPQTIRQQGTVVGVTGWPLVPSPLLPAQYEHQERRSIALRSPLVLQQNQNMMYAVEYSYEFSSTSPWSGYPHEDYH